MDPSERDCLVGAIIQHAAGDTIAAQIGVAQAIMRRSSAEGETSGICGVARSSGGRAKPCIGATCRHAASVADRRRAADGALAQAEWLADDVASGRAWLAELADATHFDTGERDPEPSSGRVEVARFGRLVFYRAPELTLPPLFQAALPRDARDVAAGSTPRVPAYARIGPAPAPSPTVDTATTTSASAFAGASEVAAAESVAALRQRPTLRRPTRTDGKKAPAAAAVESAPDRSVLMRALTPSN